MFRGLFVMSLQKVIVFLVVTMLLFYMIKLLFFAKKKWNSGTYTFGVLIAGLIIINIATFFDMISYIRSNYYIYLLIKICFTVGAVIYVVGVILWSDYTKKMINQLQKIALTDTMTGALNRKGIEDIYSSAAQSSEFFYVMVCDLNGTKKINDNFGHLHGDKYITNTTKIITDTISLKGHVARIGGDEFIVLLGYVEFEELMTIILEIKRKVYEISPEQNTGISFGYALFPYDGYTLEELVEVADRKMYEDKKGVR